MKTEFQYDRITFEFDSGSIPPPFCHRYSVQISKRDQLYVKLDLEYYDREELSEEEILEEGFSDQDDFHWEGALPAVWGQEISRRMSKSNWRKKEASDSDGSVFRIKAVQEGISELKYPDKPLDFKILSQEIIQAVFELAKKEAPLEIGYCDKEKDRTVKEIVFKYSFAEKHAEVISEPNNPRQIDWSEGRRLMKYIFGFDYFPENGTEQIPNKEGHYISPGDGLWYTLAPHANAGKSATERIDKLVKKLKEYC